MKKVLVTGATGFIGNHVVQALLANGFQVVASASNQSKAKSKNWFQAVDFLELDLSSLDPAVNYYDYFGRPDMMIHLAWEGLPNYKADFHLTSNLPRHQLLLENMIRNGLKDLTVTGTCYEYGMQSGCLKEDFPAMPENAYAEAKNKLRLFLEPIAAASSVPLKWIRLFYMYGPGQNPNSLFSQLEKTLESGEQSFNMSGGEQVRDFLPVAEVAENIVRIAGQTAVNGIINCCSGKPVKVKDFVEQYVKEKNRQIKLNLGFYPYPTYEPMEFWGDNEKLNTIITT
jgi:dTDP-6-deoxy-L-talose 4-dehydrogenase (NAD+)